MNQPPIQLRLRKVSDYELSTILVQRDGRAWLECMMFDASGQQVEVTTRGLGTVITELENVVLRADTERKARAKAITIIQQAIDEQGWTTNVLDLGIQIAQARRIDDPDGTLTLAINYLTEEE